MLVEKAETLSTNDDARALALGGAAHGTAVLAQRQTAGRGRAGRAFASPEGGLYLSLVVRPRAPPHHWSLLPLLSGAAAASALREMGFPVELKWPNDLMMCGRKLGGVLVESRLGQNGFAIVGIGANVHASPAGVAEATCLAAHGVAPDARALAEAVRSAVVLRVARLDADGPRGVLPEVRAFCGTLGRRVEWEKGEGVAVDVADDGALVLEMDGATVRVVAGDVRLKVR
ncbi:MAG TPA: biotin--[acetyl-CoA-carboxylase] ligase [Candidatus Thermoplasmatota archaeon]|nr:biotin--[acetyl-CoA-carboxylase] ligase [Candidatus Thermoplasmatota archaeon]